ncbi:hypothetical protein Tco_0286632 [Tanacetum coccineum]
MCGWWSGRYYVVRYCFVKTLDIKGERINSVLSESDPTSFCSHWHVPRVASDKHTTDHSKLLITNFAVQLHSGHGHLDVPHVVDDLGKPDIIFMNGVSFVLTEVFKDTIQL